MVKSLRGAVVAAVGGGFAVSALALGAGVASAQPDLSPAVNTTCNYGQVMAALNDQRPDLAGQFNSSPMAQSMVRSFLASPPAARQRTVNSLSSSPMAQEYFDPILQIVGSCNRY